MYKPEGLPLASSLLVLICWQQLQRLGVGFARSVAHSAACLELPSSGEREGGREGEREREREGKREGGREGERGREGGKEREGERGRGREREGGREGRRGREGGREREREGEGGRDGVGANTRFTLNRLVKPRTTPLKSSCREKDLNPQHSAL